MGTVISAVPRRPASHEPQGGQQPSRCLDELLCVSAPQKHITLYCEQHEPVKSDKRARRAKRATLRGAPERTRVLSCGRMLLVAVVLCVPGTVAQTDSFCDIPDIDECASSPCANGATCWESSTDASVPHHAYRCACAEGFANGTCATGWLADVPEYAGLCDASTGGNCDVELDECLSSPCLNSESCIEADPHTFQCEHIASDPCLIGPCENGGSCSLAAPGDGRYQWVLQCAEGTVPIVSFSASAIHREVTVYDGSSDSETPELLSCGGYCSPAEGDGCRTCTEVSGTGQSVKVVLGDALADEQESWITATYTCNGTAATGGRRRLQNCHDNNALVSATLDYDYPGIVCPSAVSMFGCDYEISAGHPLRAYCPLTCGSCSGESGSSGECKDDSTFVDAQGFACTAWLGYDCADSAEWGYGAEEEATIFAACPVTCGNCDITGGRRRLQFTEPSYAAGAATPVVEETATSEFGTTYQLSLELSSAEANVYTIYGSSDSNGGSAGGSCEDTYTDDAANVYHIFEQPLGSSKAVVFDVQAGNDAHVGFFSDAADSGEVYEIVISGWGNQQSVIRECNQCPNQVTVATPGLLDGNSPTSFWADAVDGLVRLGTGSDVGENTLMQWQDPAHHEAVYVGVMTGWGSDGQWNVCHDGWDGSTPVFAEGAPMTFPAAYNSGLGGDIGVSPVCVNNQPEECGSADGVNTFCDIGGYAGLGPCAAWDGYWGRRCDDMATMEAFGYIDAEGASAALIAACPLTCGMC